MLPLYCLFMYPSKSMLLIHGVDHSIQSVLIPNYYFFVQIHPLTKKSQILLLKQLSTSLKTSHQSVHMVHDFTSGFSLASLPTNEYFNVPFLFFLLISGRRMLLAGILEVAGPLESPHVTNSVCKFTNAPSKCYGLVSGWETYSLLKM